MGGGGKGAGDWAMLLSNPVQAVVPEIFGIKDWDPISSGFSYLTGKIVGEDTSGYKPTYAGGPGYTPAAQRTMLENQKAWNKYYQDMAVDLRSRANASASTSAPTPTSTLVTPRKKISLDEEGSLLLDEEGS